MTTDHERDDPRRKAFRHAGASYHLTTGRLRNTVHVFTEAEDHVGAVTQLALPHAVWEWLRDAHTPPTSEPLRERIERTIAHLDQPNMLTFMSRGDAIALLSNLLNDELWGT
jgi:hypothetical protein